MAEKKTLEERAAEREARKQAKKAADAARWEQERNDKALMLDALRDVLRDKTATPAQRLYAVAALDYAGSYHIVPYSMKYPDAQEDERFLHLRAKFAAELAKAEGTADATTE